MNLNYNNFNDAYNDFITQKYGMKDLQEIIRVTDEIRKAAEQRIYDAERTNFEDLKEEICELFMKMREIRANTIFEIRDEYGEYHFIHIDDMIDGVNDIKYWQNGATMV